MIEKQFKGNIGVFLVCAELSKKNLIAMPTSRNTKGCDIVVLNPQTNKSIGLQVKCTDEREFPILNFHWRNYEQRIEEKILFDFVFVDISNSDKPNYFVLSCEEMKNTLKSNVENCIHDFTIKKGLTLDNLVERERIEKRNPQQWTKTLDEIKEYKDNWGTITNKLS